MRRSGFIGVSGQFSLMLRMVLVAVLTPVISIALLVAVLVLLPQRYLWLAIPGIALALVVRVGKARSDARKRPAALTRDDDPELFDVVERLCAVADIAMPEIVRQESAQPNSWVVHYPGQRPRLHVTSELRVLLTLEELSAVIAHELSHIANRDALVMSVVDLPGSVMRAGNYVGNIDIVLMRLIGALAYIATASLSRDRELAADQGAALITGRPSLLAAALIKVAESPVRVPTKDLRAAAALNAFNLVAVEAPKGRFGFERKGLLGTHPSLDKRLDALEAMERSLHNAG